MLLDEIGLAFIALGWIVQLIHVMNGKKEVHLHFLAAYIIGVITLLIGSRESGLNLAAIINIISAVVALIIYLKVRK